MIISITGREGAGKTTVAKLLAEKLSYKNIYIGDLRRKAAADRAMTLDEYNKLGLKDSSTDTQVDNYAKKICEQEDNIVIQGRTMWYFIPQSFKVYLNVEPQEGARRVFQDLQKNSKQRNETLYQNIEEAKQGLAKRATNDKLRYKKHYGIENVHDLKHFDLVIDTTNIPPDKVVEKILDSLPEDEIRKI